MMRTYFIDDKEVTEEEFNTELENAVYAYCEDNFDSYLNRVFGDADGDIDLAGIAYDFSTVLYAADRIRYNCMFSDYQSDERYNAKGQLDSGDEVNVNGSSFRIEENYEEDEED